MPHQFQMHVEEDVSEKLKSEAKKRDTYKNWPLIKNPQFLSYPYETW